MSTSPLPEVSQTVRDAIVPMNSHPVVSEAIRRIDANVKQKKDAFSHFPDSLTTLVISELWNSALTDFEDAKREIHELWEKRIEGSGPEGRGWEKYPRHITLVSLLEETIQPFEQSLRELRRAEIDLLRAQLINNSLESGELR